MLNCKDKTKAANRTCLSLLCGLFVSVLIGGGIVFHKNAYAECKNKWDVDCQYRIGEQFMKKPQYQEKQYKQEVENTKAYKSGTEGYKFPGYRGPAKDEPIDSNCTFGQC